MEKEAKTIQTMDFIGITMEKYQLKQENAQKDSNQEEYIIENMNNLQQYIDGYKSYQEDDRKARRKGKNATNEFFTPYSIVVKMMDKISVEDWADPKKTFLEPSCGSGNFVVGILYRRIVEYNIDWKQALKTTFALDLVSSNVDEMKERVHTMLSQICPDYNKASASRIMNKNFICHDFFTWNFEEWRPMTEEEIKTSKRKK